MTIEPKDKISITYNKKLKSYTVHYPSGERETVFSSDTAYRLAMAAFSNLNNQRRAPKGGIRIEFDPINLEGKELPTLKEYIYRSE